MYTARRYPVPELHVLPIITKSDSASYTLPPVTMPLQQCPLSLDAQVQLGSELCSACQHPIPQWLNINLRARLRV